MKRNHWIMVGVLFIALYLALQDPAGAGHLLQQVLQGIGSLFSSARKS